MRNLFAFLSLIAFVYGGDDIAEPDKDEVKQAEDRHNFLTRIAFECSDSEGIPLEDANKLLLGDLSIRSAEAKCFVSCIFKKEGFFNETDEPQIDYIVDSLVDSVKIKRKKLEKLIKKCANSKTEDPCEAAFQFLECYLTNNVITKTEL